MREAVASRFWSAIQRWTPHSALPAFLIGFAVLSTAAHRIIAYLAGLAFLSMIVRRGWFPAHIDRLFAVFLLLFLGYAAVSVSWSGVGVSTFLDQARPLLLLPLFFAAFHFVAESSGARALENQLAWAFFLMLAFGCGIPLLSILVSGEFGRLEGLGHLRNPILLSAASAISLIGALTYRSYLSARIPRVLFWGVISIGAVSMLVTMSRGPLLALAVVVLVLAMWKRSKLLVGACVPAVLAVAGMVAFRSDWGAGIAEAANLFQAIDSARITIWQEAFHRITQSPILGHGIATEARFGTEIVKDGFSSTHNIYLGTLFYLGVTGFLLAALLWGRAFMLAITRLPAGPSKVLCISLFIFGAALGFVEFDHLYTNLGIEWLVFWLAPSIAVALTANLSVRHG